MRSYLTELTSAIEGIPQQETEALRDHIKALRTTGHTLFICGNGGSYSVAQHWALDLAKVGLVQTHHLGSNPALLTAYSNDLGYDVGMSTELALQAKLSDTLICLSCSGRSTNILSTISQAQKLKMPVYLITGVKAPHYNGIRPIYVDSTDYGVLEDTFSIMGHWLTREVS